MHKIILTLALFLSFQVLADELEPIKLGVKYNEATARVEAFKNIQNKVEKEFYKKYLKDPNKKENIEYIKNETLVLSEGWTLCPFYIKETLATYAVIYDETPQYVFYYNILGNLVKFDIIDNTEEYPKKIKGYSRFGNLMSVAFEVDEQEQFVYDENGKLKAHWLGKTLLNKDNKNPKLFKLERGFIE